MLYLITLFICFITSALFKDTRVVGFLAMMYFAYLAGFADPSTTTDYPVYLAHYNSLGWENSPFERGYTLMSMMFSNHGIDYAHFRIWFSFIALLILFLGVCLFTKRVSLFMGLYGITVFFNDATQIRNLMMISLVILGTGLLSKDNKFSQVFGLISLILSTQFHDLGFLFLIVIVVLQFVNLNLIKMIYKYIVFILFALGFVFSIGSNSFIISLFASFLTKFSSRSNSAENVIVSFGRGNSIRNVILIWCTLLLVSIMLTLLLNVSLSMGLEDNRQLKLLFIGGSISMLVSFLIVLAPDYSRISRNAFFFIILFVCWVLDKKVRILWTRRNVFRLALFLSLILLTTYSNTVIWGPTYYNSIPYLAKIKK